jgi:hypothetical protein
LATADGIPWYAIAVEEAAERLRTDLARGLAESEARRGPANSGRIGSKSFALSRLW